MWGRRGRGQPGRYWRGGWNEIVEEEIETLLDDSEYSDEEYYDAQPRNTTFEEEIMMIQDLFEKDRDDGSTVVFAFSSSNTGIETINEETK